MADEFLRIGGRHYDSETGKAISTDESGVVYTQLAGAKSEETIRVSPSINPGAESSLLSIDMSKHSSFAIGISTDAEHHYRVTGIPRDNANNAFSSAIRDRVWILENTERRVRSGKIKINAPKVSVVLSNLSNVAQTYTVTIWKYV